MLKLRGIHNQATRADRRWLAASLGLLALDAALLASPVILVFAVLANPSWVSGTEGLTVALLAGGAAIGRFAALLSAQRIRYRVLADVVSRSRSALSEHVRSVSLGTLQSIGAARIALGLFDDHALIENVQARLVPHVVVHVLLSVVLIVVLGWLSPPMAAVAVAVAALAIPLHLVTQKQIAAFAKRRNAALVNASRRMGDYVEGIATLRVFGRAGQAAASFREAVEDCHAIHAAALPGLVTLGAATRSFIDLGLCGAIGLGCWLFVSGALSGPALLAACAALLVVAQSLTAILGEVFKLNAAADAGARIAALRELPLLPSVPARTGGGGLDIRFENVSLAFDGKPALDDVSFVIPAGGVTAIVGPSGSGKSSLLNLMMRFRDPQSGRIFIGGDDIRAMAPEMLHATVTPVFQDVHIFRDTVAENIGMGQPASSADLSRAADMARCASFIARLPDGFDTMLGRGIDLSGGERQRLSIARALLKDAPILLLDEPTASIDASNERAIQDALAEIARRKTLVMVTHRLSAVTCADRIVVMDRGRIDAIGTHEAVLACSKIYQRLWNTHEAVLRWTV